MAEMISALATKFAQVASAHKSTVKEPGPGSPEDGAFWGVLNGQIATTEVAAALGSLDSKLAGLAKLGLDGMGIKIGFSALSGTDSAGERGLDAAGEAGASMGGVMQRGLPGAQANGTKNGVQESTADWPMKSGSEQIKSAVVVLDAASESAKSAGVSETAEGDALSLAESSAPLLSRAEMSADSASKTAKAQAEQDADGLNQDASGASISAVLTLMPATKSTETTRFEGLVKSSRSGKDAANAADARQSLPISTEVAKAEAALSADQALPLSRLESATAMALQPTPGMRAEASASATTTSLHSFDSGLRQSDSRINVAIESPVRSNAFAGELASKVVWLAGRQGQLAELSLNPQQMGALEVRLSVSGGDAAATFFSPNPAVREAIDAALPKLRELMAQAGLNLGETEVRDHAFNREERPDAKYGPNRLDGENVAGPAMLINGGGVRSAGLGLVDLYI